MPELRRNQIALTFTAPLLLAGSLLAACSGSNPLQPFDIIGVHVQGAGAGAGSVVAQDVSVLTIECGWPGNTGSCEDQFEDAGGGGVFNLTALPSPGSVLAEWTGCSQVNGTTCTLTFGQFIDDTSFSVTARFEPSGEGTNTVMMYNAAEVSANLVGPGENPGPGNLVASHGPARHVTVPSAVGSMPEFRAYVGGNLVATKTCQVTAAAWQNDSEPLVALYDTDGYYLTCEGF
jgi:hypothetical protein